jgi:hypothetical protein
LWSCSPVGEGDIVGVETGQKDVIVRMALYSRPAEGAYCGVRTAVDRWAAVAVKAGNEAFDIPLVFTPLVESSVVLTCYHFDIRGCHRVGFNVCRGLEQESFQERIYMYGSSFVFKPAPLQMIWVEQSHHCLRLPSWVESSVLINSNRSILAFTFGLNWYAYI